MADKRYYTDVREVNDWTEAKRMLDSKKGWVLLDEYHSLIRHEDGQCEHVPNYVLALDPDKVFD